MTRCTSLLSHSQRSMPLCGGAFAWCSKTSLAISSQMHQQNPADAPPESRGTTRIRRTPTESCLHLQRAFIIRSIWRFRDFTRSWGKTSYRLLNGGLGYAMQWLYITWSILSQAMAYWLTVPNHNRNQCWRNICNIHWFSHEDEFTRDASATDNQHECETCIYIISFMYPKTHLVLMIKLILIASMHMKMNGLSVMRYRWAWSKYT